MSVLALLLSVTLMFTNTTPSYIRKMQRVLNNFLVALIDTQIVLGLALTIPTVSFMKCYISTYHLDLLSDLITIATTSILSSAMAVDWHSASKALWVRLVFAWGILLLTVTILGYKADSPILPTFTPHDEQTNKSSTGLVLPAMCFIGHPNKKQAKSDLQSFTTSSLWTKSASGSAVNGTEVTGIDFANNSTGFSTNLEKTAACPACFESFTSNDNLSKSVDTFLLVAVIMILALSHLYLFLANRARHPKTPKQKKGKASARPKAPNRKFYIVIGAVCWLLSVTVMIICSVRFRQLQEWMLASGWMSNKGEEQPSSLDTYGEFMPLMLLIIPVIAGFEACFERGKSCLELPNPAPVILR
ncbi:uncharacterized protein KY384_002395 [Bacidia gigantensis]|uniref:uncharacterized protein n=1 Tax=Bacidia gigantensis TaxID=2732470 RepID=UPI001D044256|nr:uncharacterized protein KY384_002395 [Bacidia gigantensis]KAG8532518.1 hypothetical protein KY384_002395 [Bacidia gigantensis]